MFQGDDSTLADNGETIAAEVIAAALGRYIPKAGGGFMACCPAHNDRSPSLSIDVKDGKLLYRCMAGCDQRAVGDALKLRNLFPGKKAPSITSARVEREVWQPVMPVPNSAPLPPTGHFKNGNPSARWQYRDVAGKLLGEICRFNKQGGGKEVLPLTFCDSGKRREWRWQAFPEPRPLYGLELIGDADHVVVVEGEKTADAARRLLGKKRPVVTWPGGCNAVGKTDWTPLSGKFVCIWPDADEPGIKAALTVAEILAGLSCVTKIVEPPEEVSQGWDLADAEAGRWTEQRVREILKAAVAAKNFRSRHCQGQPEKKGTYDELDREQPAQEGRLRVVDIADFLSLALPPREMLLAPWLPKQGLAMAYAPRGLGKTHFSLGVAYAVASGGTFMRWAADAPRGVLFIDGEMPARVLQERLAAITVSHDKEPTAPLRIVTPDLQPRGMIDLSRQEDQAELAPFLENISLIIVDNLSTLCRTGKEKDGDDWLPVQGWALQQRAAGRSVLFIHHSGKNGEQRGTSRREDVLDTVVALRRPGDYTPDRGASFEVHFEKARGLYGEDTKPFEATLITAPDGRQHWVMQPLEDSTVEKVAKLLSEGVRQNDIADLIGVNKGTVSKAKSKAMALGLVKVS
ncbi:MAG: hypothetical protein FDZ69_06530 [Deltaproteobacteria bacterium]|nr:MAG: hypothetical protein FDZ69_06530 [Deltaproteobacteria bacterium]